MMDCNGLFLTVFIGFYPVKFYLFRLNGIWMHGIWYIAIGAILTELEDGGLIFFIEIILIDGEICNSSCIKKIENLGSYNT